MGYSSWFIVVGMVCALHAQVTWSREISTGVPTNAGIPMEGNVGGNVDNDSIGNKNIEQNINMRRENQN